jgi:hypothetical protein
MPVERRPLLAEESAFTPDSACLGHSSRAIGSDIYTTVLPELTRAAEVTAAL